MPKITVITPDLMFFTQVAEAAKRAGFDAVQAHELQEIDPGSAAIVIELRQGLDPAAILENLTAAAVNVPLIAFGPHVQKDLLEAAEEAGYAFVGRRSQVALKLPELLKGLEQGG